MKSKYVVSLILISLVFKACSSVAVRNDYDTEFNFAQFRSYKIVNKSTTKAEAKMPVSLEFNRVSRAVDMQLQRKGFVKKEIDPDFIVTFHSSVEKKLSVETTNHHRWRGVWIAEREVREYRQGILVLDIINRVTKNVVWKGWLKGVDENLSPSQEDINELISELLAGFPPVR